MGPKWLKLLSLAILCAGCSSQPPDKDASCAKCEDAPQDSEDSREDSEDVYQVLTSDGPGATRAIDKILRTSEECPSLILLVASGVAFKQKRLEDSAFLFYTARLKACFDKECFPPRDTGGDSPFTAFVALQHQLGSQINPAVAAKPKVFAKVLERVRTWSPKATRDYDPLYEYVEKRTEQSALDATQDVKTKFLRQMTGLCELLNDAEYFAAFRVCQAYNLESDDPEPTQAAYEKAMQTMSRIEEERGISGVANRAGKNERPPESK